MTTERPELASPRLSIEIPRDSRGRIGWRILRRDRQLLSLAIEDQARQILEEVGRLTQRLLAERNRKDLAVAITRHYPGGLRQLKINLGQEPVKKPNGYWQSPENILLEARRFLTTHEVISADLLKRSGNSSLNNAIVSYYPGGTTQLKRDLGIQVSRRPNQFWNEATIEQEARDFYEQHDGLDTSRLSSEGRNDLLVAITTKYPNKWPGLYEKLGLQSPQKEKGYWSVARIEQEAQEFYTRYGRLSATLLKKMTELTY